MFPIVQFRFMVGQVKVMLLSNQIPHHSKLADQKKVKDILDLDMDMDIRLKVGTI